MFKFKTINSEYILKYNVFNRIMDKFNYIFIMGKAEILKVR